MTPTASTQALALTAALFGIVCTALLSLLVWQVHHVVGKIEEIAKDVAGVRVKVAFMEGRSHA